MLYRELIRERLGGVCVFCSRERLVQAHWSYTAEVNMTTQVDMVQSHWILTIEHPIIMKIHI